MSIAKLAFPLGITAENHFEPTFNQFSGRRKDQEALLGKWRSYVSRLVVGHATALKRYSLSSFAVPPT